VVARATTAPTITTTTTVPTKKPTIQIRLDSHSVPQSMPSTAPPDHLTSGEG
jgi:hypothetical protein